MAQQVGCREIQRHLQDRPERILSQGKSQDQREDNETENVVNHRRSQDGRSLFGVEFAQLFERLGRDADTRCCEQRSKKQAHRERIAKRV